MEQAEGYAELIESGQPGIFFIDFIVWRSFASSLQYNSPVPSSCLHGRLYFLYFSSSFPSTLFTYLLLHYRFHRDQGDDVLRQE